MSAIAKPGAVHAQGGFALIVLLSLVGFGSIGVLLAVQALVPTLRDRSSESTDHVVIAAGAAANAYHGAGAFPSDLDALQLAGGLPATGAWRRDPYGAGQELDYGFTSSGVRIRSRGADGRLGTADDVEQVVATETQLRRRQRMRLRMLRAVLLRSAFRLSGSMSVADQAQMRTAMHSYADARRSWLTADTTQRAALTLAMGSAVASINALVALHGLPVLPTALTGAGGLMSQLSLPSTLAVDGSGAQLLADPVVGWIAVGADGIGGTDDDM